MRILIFILVMLTCKTALSQIQVDRARLIKLLQEGKTAEVFKEANRLRDSVYGKCALVDYFIAKSLCMDKYYDRSSIWFDYILAKYPMDDGSLAFIRQEKNACQPGRPAPLAAGSTLLTSMTIPLPKVGAGVRGRIGKGGYIVEDCYENKTLVSYDNMLPDETLAARIFNMDQPDTALAKLQSFLPAAYEARVYKRFILVTLKDRSYNAENLERVAGSLDRAYNFYIKYYSLRPLNKFITVYLLPSQAALQAAAQDVHHIKIGNDPLGYSILSDLSLLGIAEDDPSTIGTLYHELWHLVIRGDAGDIPAWLDEGIAGLYSNSYWENDVLQGNKTTWRLDDLRSKRLAEIGETVPSLEKLLGYDWNNFYGGADKNLCMATVNYALSNYFMIYLQEQGVLQQLIQAVKNRRPPGTDSTTSVQDIQDITLLPAVTGKNVSALQTAFRAWFKKAYSFDPYDSPQTQTAAVMKFNFQQEQDSLKQTLSNKRMQGSINIEQYNRYMNRITKIETSYTTAAKKIDEFNAQQSTQHPPANMSNMVAQQQPQQQQQTQSENKKVSRWRKKMNHAKADLMKLKEQINSDTF
ncbi:hypothetical protein SAMN04488505_10869 [Chitinophaga rupis]|uniref:Uncharacterized protein n=1 Tax=Chitinophaga rupis TaxID=573321 RepID=A0A1H8DQ32_9BACT|nr:hypothetical protein [Chitinophaga rupis]SEN09359.1 hypothetical protein SAMN04488505_10869 [Chitinophaga rupis]